MSAKRNLITKIVYRVYNMMQSVEHNRCNRKKIKTGTRAKIMLEVLQS